jgi:hypothetical protein
MLKLVLDTLQDLYRKYGDIDVFIDDGHTESMPSVKFVGAQYSRGNIPAIVVIASVVPKEIIDGLSGKAKQQIKETGIYISREQEH